MFLQQILRSLSEVQHAASSVGAELFQEVVMVIIVLLEKTREINYLSVLKKKEG